jgi:VacB/RNase II family 3'-5' exoribonuclease
MASDDHERLLRDIARRAMLAEGFQPDLPPGAAAELAGLREPALSAVRDLRGLPWSSIDNDESRDLDQVEVCIPDGARTRLLVAIADVDALVCKDSALDTHARTNTTSVYTPAEIFPMLPERLSTDRTSLNEGADRVAVVVEMAVDKDGAVAGSDLYRAIVRNGAKLTYGSVAGWLEGSAPAPEPVATRSDLADQVRLQDALARALHDRRREQGALDFARSELKPVIEGGTVRDLRTEERNRARDIIENFMVAANGATARFLSAHGLASIRRVVRSPDRWERIVDLAVRYGVSLPADPDARALESFLQTARAAKPDEFPELSLSVIKLLGRGEYVAEGPADPPDGHFALAVSNYTHSTAPNRRFPDLVTQRLVKAAVDGSAPPYRLEELTPLAAHCTKQEDAANKVERLVRKAAAALWLADRLGQEFDAVVTGASRKGTWVRLCRPPIEGKLERGFEGLDVGDRVRVRLVHTDPEQGFIDFARVR